MNSKDLHHYLMRIVKYSTAALCSHPNNGWYVAKMNDYLEAVRAYDK